MTNKRQQSSTTDLIQWMLDHFDVSIKVYRHGGIQAICIVDSETVSHGIDDRNEGALRAIFEACRAFIDKQGDPQIDEWQKTLRQLYKAALHNKKAVSNG
jgi:hypothetical protein